MATFVLLVLMGGWIVLVLQTLFVQQQQPPRIIVKMVEGDRRRSGVGCGTLIIFGLLGLFLLGALRR